MIAIAVVFSMIGYLEWTYMKHKNRSHQTRMLVMGLAIFLLLSSEALYLLRNHWSIGLFINSIFEPIQRLMFIGE